WEDHTVSLVERYDLGTRLHARSLLCKHEFAAREVVPRYRQEEGDLQWEDMLAIKILMQAVVIALAVVQEERCRPGVAGAMAPRGRRCSHGRRARWRGATNRALRSVRPLWAQTRWPHGSNGRRS